MLKVVVGIAFLGIGCGDRSGNSTEPSHSEDRVLRALQETGMTLGDSVKIPIIERGKVLYRRILNVIADRAARLEPAASGRSRKRVSAADVVLAADIHDVDLCRIAFRRIVEDLSDPAALRHGRVAIALEAIAVSYESRLAACRRRGRRDELVALLQSCWGWPIERYGDLLSRPGLKGVPVLGSWRCGNGWAATWMAGGSSSYPGCFARRMCRPAT